MSINPIIENTLAKPLRWFANTKIAKNAGENVKLNNRMYIDGLGVSSIILKDGLGCYLYVKQSLNNKDIPDDKRKFVAALDLTNGLLMIAFQLLMFFTVSNKVCQTKMFDKFFGKMFDRPMKKLYQNIVKESDPIKFTKEFESFRGKCKDAFGGLTSLAAATIVGKRMLVPFIATPLAGKVEKKLEAYQTQNASSKPAQEKTTETNTNQNKNITNESENTNLLAKYKS